MFDWLYNIFGFILTYIDKAVYFVFHTHNTGICIILFTIVVYLLMYPLNAKQQKSARLMNLIQPETKKIQKKYEGKKDQASQMKMNEEMQAVYAKYGISPFGGCLPMLVTLPIMLCLYRVIMDMGNYVSTLKPDGHTNIFINSKIFNLDIAMSPMQTYHAATNFGRYLVFLIPILAMVLQFINTKIMQSSSNTNQDENPMGQSMKMMNYFMPVMSGFFCLSLNIGIGLYWIVGSLFRIVQALIINHGIDNIDMDELVEKNKEKAAKKNAKIQERNRQMEEYAKTRTSTIKSASTYNNSAKTNDNSSSDKDTISKNYKPGSIASIAHMSTDKKKD